MHKKDRRGRGGDLQLRRQLLLVLGLQVTWINQNGEVRPATGLIDVVDRRIGALLEARCCGDRQMAARRKADNSDTCRIDRELFGLGTEQADGSLSVPG